jgi:hypothetical protein
MKKLILALTLILSFSVMADDCLEKVRADYKQLTIERNYDYDFVGDAPTTIEQMMLIWDTFETEYEGDSYIVYQASSEYYGGYGVDALVVSKNSCETVEVVEVYAE